MSGVGAPRSPGGSAAAIAAGLGAAWWRRGREAAGHAATAGNARLTASTGTLLLLPLAAVLLSGLAMEAFWHVHYLTGFVVLPLAALKLASTGWRALRYYTGSRAYRAAGPPHPLARFLGPVIAAATVLALLSGVVLWALRSRTGAWSTVHTDAAVVLALGLGLHVIDRLPRALVSTVAELRPAAGGAGAARRGIVVAALVLGVALGVGSWAGSAWPQRAPGERTPEHVGAAVR